MMIILNLKEKKEKMFKRFCRRCNKLYRPMGRYCRFCADCKKTKKDKPESYEFVANRIKRLVIEVKEPKKTKDLNTSMYVNIYEEPIKT